MWPFQPLLPASADLLSAPPAGDTFIEGLSRIEQGEKPWTAAGLGGVLQE